MTDRVDIETPLGLVTVYRTGAGEPVLLWPSLLMDHTLWTKQVEHLAGRYQTLAIDPPGHGTSSPVTRTFTLGECADCACAILDALEIPRAHIVGNSWGAMTGAVLAARYPERVASAVLLNGTASPAGRLQRMKFRVLVTAAGILGGLRPPLDRAVLRAFLGPTSLRSRPEAAETVLEVASRVNVESARYCVRSVVSQRPDNVGLLAAVSSPVLVVAGAEDRIFPISEVQAMAAAIPGAHFVVIEEAAHLLALEVPDRINELVSDFLAQHSFS
ncbi:MAG: alpha/beta hydrolase [Nocardia sp.]|uniref:alpha/beta fold hydrolase n=1 Tax=Nocardia sp. TaxID=1821 RepID=UPI00262A79B3|nr:alpha/beta hydrolase [Nocardia sp.]MCU1647013.1 alpha/beta hydrolase [Nocardia sp.]